MSLLLLSPLFLRWTTPSYLRSHPRFRRISRALWFLVGWHLKIAKRTRVKILVDLEISISFFLFSFFPPLIIFITFTRMLFIVCSTSIKDFVKTSLKMTWKSKRLHHMAIDILERDYNITQWYRNFHEAVSLNWTKIYVPTCSRLIESIDENRGCARRTLLRISHDVCAIFNLAEDQCGGVVYRGVFEASYSRGGLSFLSPPWIGEKIGLIGLSIDFRSFSLTTRYHIALQIDWTVCVSV